MLFQKRQDQCRTRYLEQCHGGIGTVINKLVLEKGEVGRKIEFMHDDILSQGTVIGEHTHDDLWEIYYIAEGQGELILDGRQQPVTKGHISVVGQGHSHGLSNTGDQDLRLLVVGFRA